MLKSSMGLLPLTSALGTQQYSEIQNDLCRVAKPALCQLLWLRLEGNRQTLAQMLRFV